ncbi:MAG: hypothetical protein ABFC24_03520 [Methanoregulaceae archaeon]
MDPDVLREPVLRGKMRIGIQEVRENFDDSGFLSLPIEKSSAISPISAPGFKMDLRGKRYITPFFRWIPGFSGNFFLVPSESDAIRKSYITK